MSNLTKIAVPALLLVAAAAVGYHYLTGSPTEPPAPPPPVRVSQPATPTPAPDLQQAAPATAPVAPQQVRESVKTSNAQARLDAPQGVKGRVLQPNGSPAAAVPVFLMENSMNDPINLFLKQKSGETTPPIASGLTAEDGTFALGTPTAGKLYDLRVTSEEYPELNFQQIKVREDEWFDTSDLTLEPGLLVTGRVVDELSKAGIADATVFLQNSNQAYAMVATPGRERGIAVLTGPGGQFEFRNAPRSGLINLSAEATGYASALLQNQQLKPEGANEFALEMARGQPIAGVVVDADGKPCPRVRVTASGLSAKTPQTAETVSLEDGSFAFETLREGPYQLVTNSTQYNETKSPPIMTGDLDVKLVLMQRAFAKLRVLGNNGQPIKAYSLSLKRHFPNNPLGIGNVPEFPDRRVNPSDYPAEFGGHWAAIRGLPNGEYVFQIQDNTHAKTLTPPFRVAESEAPPEVEVVLTLGAAITGLVVDDRGKPLAGATVITDMNNAFAGEGGFFEIFKQFIPEKHSKASVKTDQGGRFRLTKLAFADYMLRVAHPDFCEGLNYDIKLEGEGQQVDVGTITLSRGTVIEGTTTVEGLAAGQIKVTISVPQGEGGVPHVEGGAPPKPQFSTSVISSNEGTFRLLKRVPPGTYKISACRQGGENNPFMILLDMKETERVIQVQPGQDQLRIDFSLGKR